MNENPIFQKLIFRQDQSKCDIFSSLKCHNDGLSALNNYNCLSNHSHQWFYLNRNANSKVGMRKWTCIRTIEKEIEDGVETCACLINLCAKFTRTINISFFEFSQRAGNLVDGFACIDWNDSLASQHHLHLSIVGDKYEIFIKQRTWWIDIILKTQCLSIIFVLDFICAILWKTGYETNYQSIF